MADFHAPPAPFPRQRCPRCGGENGCTPAALGRFDVPCWCQDVTISLEALAQLPAAERDRSCLCARCASPVGLMPQATPPEP